MQSLPEPPLEDVKEWEEARCPVCMEHPHNAVLLLCSSHEKGCRPFMCDTSYRHSNCLDQFRKSFAEIPSSVTLQEEIADSRITQETRRETRRANLLDVRRVEDASSVSIPVPHAPCESQVQQKLMCPLCRGQIRGWVVMESARRFMNSKARNCACETCEYSGAYADLRKHARVEHPRVRPSDVNLERQNAWRTLERERDLGDVLSTMRSAFMEDRGTDGIFEGSSDSIFTSEDGNLLTFIFLFRVFRPGTRSRSRGQSRNQRGPDAHWGENYETDDDSAAREDDNGSSDNVPDSWDLNEQSGR